MNVMMGDLVLTEHEVNPVMSALLDQGLEVTAIHNHFFFETPRIFYMHVHGHGQAADIASKLKPALALIGTNAPAAPPIESGKSLAAFYGSDADSVVAGDVAMLDAEVQSVLRVLRANGINIVAIHHHMIGTTPNVIFLHYWGRGSAQKLAAGVRAAVDQLARPIR